LNKNNGNRNGGKPAVSYLNRLFSACSIRCLWILGKILGGLIARTTNQISLQCRENIRLCFPDLSERQHQDLVRQSINHTCSAFTELAALWHQPVAEILERIDIDRVDPTFWTPNQARLVIAPHHGSWELLNLWLSQQTNFHAVYKPSRNAATDAYILASRSRNGATLVPTNTGGMRRLMRALENKSTCMILPDQRPPKKSARSDSQFFGHPAKTSLLIKKLVERSQATVFIAVITRDLDTARYRLRIESVDPASLTANDETSTTYLNRCIEQIVSRNICQYQWAYRRFDETAYRSMHG
jgi:KDO2-lipid IV(A) lauroyltransferase